MTVVLLSAALSFPCGMGGLDRPKWTRSERHVATPLQLVAPVQAMVRCIMAAGCSPDAVANISDAASAYAGACAHAHHRTRARVASAVPACGRSRAGARMRKTHTHAHITKRTRVQKRAACLRGGSAHKRSCKRQIHTAFLTVPCRQFNPSSTFFDAFLPVCLSV